MTGITAFLAGLKQLGLTTEQRGELAVVTLDIAPPGAPGPHEVGTDPPGEFPRLPPHWIHLRRGLVLTEDPGRESELGPEWWKWSRAHPKWKGGDSAVRQWLAHVRSLLLAARPVS